MTRSERWILSEYQVARDRCERRGREKLVAHRERTPFAEIDLLTRSPDGSYALIEVKTCTGERWGPELISSKQIRRLQRARAYFEARYDRPIHLLLAVVRPMPRAGRLDSEVCYFPL